MDKKFSSRRTRQVYEFIRAHRHQFDIRQMCRVLEVTHSGYYAWLKHRQSARATDNARLLKLIRASFNASNGIYGSPRVFLDLREAGDSGESARQSLIASGIAFMRSCPSDRCVNGCCRCRMRCDVCWARTLRQSGRC